MSTSEQNRMPRVDEKQTRDYADQLDITGLLLQAMKFPTRKHRDAVDAIIGANAGQPGEFKRTHIWMARRCQYGGKHPSTFWRRELDVIEGFIAKTGYQIFRIERGGGIEHKATTYEDFITPAANWLMNEARRALRAGEHKTYMTAVRALMPDALRMIPRVPTEAEKHDNPLPLDDALYIQRSCTQSLNLMERALEKVAENGGDIDGFAAMMIRRYEKRVEDCKRRLKGDAEEGGLQICNPPEEKSQENADILTPALDYACRGIPVFPVRADKTPLTPRGFKDATTDEETIRRWWRKHPDAGIGVPTGAASGWLAIDSDPRHGGDASLCELIEKYGDFPATRVARTGGGGQHLIYQYPKGSDIRNSAGKLGAGVDVRADGGYVVVAPSPHKSGGRYEWMNDEEPAPAPEWVLNLLTEEKPRAAVPLSKAGVQVNSRAAAGDVIGEGSRNDTLFKIACSLKGKGAAIAEIEAELLDINARRCSPPLPLLEVQKIVRSVSNPKYQANRVAAGA